MVKGNLCAAGVLAASPFEMSGQYAQPPLDIFLGVGGGGIALRYGVNGCRDEGCEESFADLGGIATCRKLDSGLVAAAL